MGKKAKARMNCEEIAGGQSTVEWVALIGVAIGLTGAAVLFRDSIGTTLGTVGTKISAMFTSISTKTS